MGRAGRNIKPEDPERRCIATGEVQPKAGLIRFVASPDGTIVPDLAAKLPGRGIWVSADRAALDKAVTKRLFARGAKAAVTVPDGLIDLVEAGLTRRVIEGVSMARKAGQAVCGYEKVKGWLLTGEAAYLMQANDGSGRGKSKLSPPDGPGSFIGCLNAGEMGLAFGREHVIHGALAAGGLAKRVVEDAARLTGVRKTDGAAAPKEGTKTI